MVFVYPNRLTLVRWAIVGLLVTAVVGSGYGQNTKGDRPQQNQRQVRETRNKSIFRKERTRTRDISGRRLRTLNKSSANRANTTYRQPNPYASRSRVNNNVPSRTRVRVNTSRPRETRRAWVGDIAGKPIRRVQPRKTEAARTNIYAQRGPLVRNFRRSPREQRTFRVTGQTASGSPVIRRTPKPISKPWRGNLRGQRVQVRSATSRIKNIYPQRNPFSAFGRFPEPSDKREKKSKMRSTQVRTVSALRRRVGGQPAPVSVSGRSRVTPGRKNVYWGKEKRKGRAVTTDLAGRPLRTRNFRSATPALVDRDTLRTFRKRPVSTALRWSERKRPASATRGPRVWKGDLAGSPVRKRKPKTTFNVKGPLAPTYPGASAWFLGRALRKTKGAKPFKGGGSVSDGARNNRGQPIPVRQGGGASGPGAQYRGRINFYKQRGFETQGSGYRGKLDFYRQRGIETSGGRYRGKIKSSRPQRGGGSVSGRPLDNGGRPVLVRMGGRGSLEGGVYRGKLDFYKQRGIQTAGGNFKGRLKGSKPVKGGGSVSSRSRNNGDRPVAVRTGGRGSLEGGMYRGKLDFYKQRGVETAGGKFKGKLDFYKQRGIEAASGNFKGKLKASKPLKGGGSISSRPRNNGDRPVAVRTGGRGSLEGGMYRGRLDFYKQRGIETAGGNFKGKLKASKPLKGGGSISSRPRNNGDRPVEVRAGGRGTLEGGIYRGKLDFYKQRGFETAGGNYKGSLKAEKPKKGGGSVSGKLWNNQEKPIAPRLPTSGYLKDVAASGLVKTKRGYRQNPEAHKSSAKKRSPTDQVAEVNELQVRVRIPWDYKRSPSASPDALKTIGPTREWVKATKFSGRSKQRFPYRHNPNSNTLALDGRYPGRAYAKIASFDGELKVKRYADGRLHPDAQFAHSRRRSQLDNRSWFTNVKLWWVKNFRKNETQPQYTKERIRKPRYDKREIGLWYE